MNHKAESRRQKAEGRTRRASPFLPTAYCQLPSDSRGFSLIELVITITVLAILTLGTIPLAQVAVKRQKEQELRESLRAMREAIDQFHREAIAGAQLQINQQQGQGQGQGQGLGQGQQQGQGQGQVQRPANIFADPRVRVGITDQTIFTTDNPDRYPPDLETLVKGVNVLPLASTVQPLGGGGLNGTKSALEQNDSLIPKTKIYLRSIPVDPITGKKEWDFRSCYDTAGSNSWGGENIFDVHSKSKGTALNGEKYSDW
ncbi:MAG: ral secretion pathway protein [Blastocatellia bacterium]|nr:ral secretion pathway protein [Blastocatellia bacterium]